MSKNLSTYRIECQNCVQLQKGYCIGTQKDLKILQCKKYKSQSSKYNFLKTHNKR